ncbi:hypothetical protein ABZX90_02850 [Streptomyces sp. NPDC002935]|uniref:hypothetical protein n=1 Tax=Streptomyces sp. NPDC002935 TaxID=3154545 RepID=UPI0033B3EA51
MSESPPSLSETLERLDARIAEQGLDRGDVLDPRALPYRTALPEQRVRVLPAGGASCDGRVDEGVRGRGRAPYEVYLAKSGRRPSLQHVVLGGEEGDR